MPNKGISGILIYILIKPNGKKQVKSFFSIIGRSIQIYALLSIGGCFLAFPGQNFHTGTFWFVNQNNEGYKSLIDNGRIKPLTEYSWNGLQHPSSRMRQKEIEFKRARGEEVPEIDKINYFNPLSDGAEYCVSTFPFVGGEVSTSCLILSGNTLISRLYDSYPCENNMGPCGEDAIVEKKIDRALLMSPAELKQKLDKEDFNDFLFSIIFFSAIGSPVLLGIGQIIVPSKKKTIMKKGIST